MSGAEVTEAALESARELIRQVAAREKAPEA